jgi:hypothetical protein
MEEGGRYRDMFMLQASSYLDDEVSSTLSATTRGGNDGD